MTDEEMKRCFQYLVGKTTAKEAMPKEIVTAEDFAADLLGFEEYEEGDEEADIDTGLAGKK